MADYSFKNVKLLINGVPIEGFAGDNDDINLEPDGDYNMIDESSDGLAYTTQIVTSMCNLTVKLNGQSSSNDYLMGIYNTGKITGNINLVISIMDFSGDDKAVSTKAVITRPASLTKGKGSAPKTWTFRGQFDIV